MANSNLNASMLVTKEKVVDKELARRFLNKMTVLSGIYSKVQKARAVTKWHEETIRQREKQARVKNFTQVFTFLMSQKHKQISRLALKRFYDHRDECYQFEYAQ